MCNYWPTALQLTYEQSLSNSIFSLILTSYRLIVLRNTEYHITSAHYLGAILHSKITNKKAHTCEQYATN